MSITAWIIIAIFTIVAIVFMTRIILDTIWQKRLNKFKESQNIAIDQIPKHVLIKNAYIAALSVFVVTGVLMTSVNYEHRIANKIYQQAQQITSKEQLSTMLSQSQYNYDGGFPENVDSLEDGAGADDRSYTDTNIQVEGVDEADVIKTDGYQIYYAPAYMNTLNVFEVDEFGDISLDMSLTLDTFYISGIFLTDTQVILIGYNYEENPYYSDALYEGWIGMSYSASVRILNRESMETIYDLETDGYFNDYRLIGDMLYLFSNKYVYLNSEEYRPTYLINQDGQSTSYQLPYENIYYFEDQMSAQMTMITSLNLSTLTFSAQAFMVGINQIYADTSSFYTTSYYSSVDEEGSYIYQNRILKFSIDSDESLKYVASATVEGYIENQYWMDAYNDYFRVVTTEWTGINRLYIFKEDEELDQLNQVSVIEEGLGKVNETVKSVRFNQDIAQVVTFEQTDPLYTINLSDPENPFILENPIEEEGYSAYLHVWGQDDYLVGFGFDADASGFVTNLKLSAYDSALTEPLDTYTFENDDENYQYNWSEAIYNPRALLINVDKGLFGFPVSSYRYSVTEQTYVYEALYYIFEIDFNRLEVIGEPIIISHDMTSYYNYIDRGVEIENKIYTFSRSEVVVYDLTLDVYSQTLKY
ncbi:beta-propeller domain-containing protein [Mycoplasmatota bacterium]|nr:beta-propeller domain-containing protein [Mycoplasmatota bacterium]